MISPEIFKQLGEISPYIIVFLAYIRTATLIAAENRDEQNVIRTTLVRLGIPPKGAFSPKTGDPWGTAGFEEDMSVQNGLDFLPTPLKNMNSGQVKDAIEQDLLKAGFKPRPQI